MGPKSRSIEVREEDRTMPEGIALCTDRDVLFD